MINSTESNNGFVPRAAHNKLRATATKLHKDKGKLIEECMRMTKHIEDLEAKNEGLEHSMRTAKMCVGRNQIKRGNYTGTQLVNADIVGKLLRRKVFHKIKFLHSSWSKFAPNDPNSFYRKIIVYLDVPEGVVSLEIFGLYRLCQSSTRSGSRSVPTRTLT